MGYKHIGDILEDIESTAKERVRSQNKVTENSNSKNSNKRTIQVQVKNIDWSCTIGVVVLNIDSNLNSSMTRQKRVNKKLIIIDTSETFIATFSSVI